jgi:hypothetical protein
VTSNRSIAALCQENVVFMALSADSAPHLTTIADFVLSLKGEIVSLFRDVLRRARTHRPGVDRGYCAH